MRFLIGLILIGIGIAIIRFRYQIYEFTGDWDLAVKYLGGSGTILAIVFIGMGCIASGAAYPFGTFDDINKSNTIQPFGQNK